MTEFKREALLAIETLRARVRQLEDAKHEPIAIVGLAARFPGAPDAEAFWNLLQQGGDAVTRIPSDRWDADTYYDADPDAAGKMYSLCAGFIDDVAGFDAQFFGVSPREAMYMDPQHRLMLETSWQALEHACIGPAAIVGTRTGVFMGLSTHEYLGLLTRHTSYAAIDVYTGTGTSPAAGAGRISYRLGLEGPAVTVDTACSSSLVAIHQACQALRAGECDAALAGGVNVMLTPAPMINLSRARMLALAGRCRTFDEAADGYVRGEGCGVIVLKRLSDAERDGDRIRAVIRGSAVNQDGASGGLTVPNGRAQQRVIQDALRQAGVEPGEVDYLEAHGTGTSLGDPIEVQAAGAVLGVGRSKEQALWIGSVKTNIGHLEAASGIAGLIKVVLSMEHGMLPKHLHFQKPSPHIAWERLAVKVVREAMPWRKEGKRRVAGISSFGFSGTNAHVVVEEAPERAADPAAGMAAGRYHLLALSARTPEALREMVGRYEGWLEAHPEAAIGDVCYTAAVGRSHLEHRAGLVLYSRERGREMLRALAEERPLPGLYSGVSNDPPKTAWLFTGQGSQYAGMGRELYETQPVFRQTLEACQEELREHLEQPLLEVMFGEQQPLGHTSYAQPALFALEMSLARMWQQWGLEPDVVVGHSVGQYAAACVAGVFPMEEGLRLLAQRGKLFGGLPSGGRMAAVFAEAGQVEERLEEYPRLSVAAYNGAHTVVSGPGEDVEAVVGALQQKGVRCELLETSHAFHSVLLEPALEEFESYARKIDYQAVERTLICNRTGKVLTGQAVLDAGYWRRHARQPVQFAESVQTLSQLGCKLLLEVGPQPVLSATALRAWPEGREAPRAVASLRREVADSRQIVEAVAQMYVAGSRPNFQAFHSPWPRLKLDLPTYPFQRRRFWFDVAATTSASDSLPYAEQPPVDVPVAEAPLHSSSGNGAHNGPAVLAPFKRFFENGNSEIPPNGGSSLTSSPKLPGYFSIDLERLFDEHPLLGVKLLRDVAQGFENGTLKPLRLQIASVDGSSSAGADDWLTATEPANRQARLRGFLLDEFARALRVSADAVDPTAPFVTLGMDSLMAMELRSRIQTALCTAIPATLFFTSPNVEALVPAVLSLWLETRADPAKRHSPIHRISREGQLVLSYAQEQIWFLHQLLPSSSAYNVAVRIRIRGPLDYATLAASFNAMVARHEILRTTFRNEMGLPQAVIAGSLPLDLPIDDVSVESEVTAWGLRDASSAFDVASGPLFRVRLLRFDEAHHVLLLTMHHIITDGWSFGVMLKELGDVYQALQRGEPSPLAELAVQYVDYAAWQREWLRGDVLESLRAFWKDDLAGAPSLDLSTDRPRRRMPSFRGARIRFELGRSRTQALRRLCEEESVTLFIPLMAAFAALLQRYSGQDDFVIGTLTANRTRLEIENLIGFFVNALPVRLSLDGDPDVRELLSRIRRRLLDVMAHQELPFDLIVNATERGRDASRNPLFQVQLVLQGAAARWDLKELGLEVDEIDSQTAKRDLTLTFFDDETLSGHVEYATDLFDSERIEQLIRHLEIVVDSITSDRGRRLSSLSLLTETEQAFCNQRNETRGTSALSIQQMFENVVDRTPDAIAVTAAGRSLTYRELDAAANRLAQWLRKRGVQPNTAVALRAGRSLDMPIGFLGILKAGGVYVPIDGAYPKDRIEYMLADANTAFLVEDVDGPEIAAESPERVEPLTTLNHLAYIIYTSGSTGRPKGVLVTHGSVVEYADTLGRELGIRPDDIYLHTASSSFSSSIRQLMVPLAAGAAVVIAAVDECREPVALLKRVRNSGVTIVDLVPTVVRQVVDAVAALSASEKAKLLDYRLRLLLTASEPLRFGLVRDWRTHFGTRASWINMYGQTETTGIVSLYPVPESSGDDHGIVPIGRPRGNVSMFVLDRSRRLVPCGVAGDLYICGEALALGYTGDPALTAERFFLNPLNGGQRLYAAGDVVRLAWDGTIEFLRRADQQVKIRGRRVEPAEIESVLLEHPGVREAVVAVSDNGHQGGQLIAYFTLKGPPIPTSALREHVRQKLPEHMVPSAFVGLETLPLTPVGKLDRRALPEVEPVRSDDVEYVPPRAGVEEELANIWRDVLKVDRVGAADNFFLLGGHSLLAVQVRSRIQRCLGVELPLGAMFEDQTLSSLATRIETSSLAGWKGALPPLLPTPRVETMPASYAQESIWQLERAEPGLGVHWIDVSLRIRGPVDTPRLVQSVQKAVERHEVLRSVFRPSGGSLFQVILGSYVPGVRVTHVQDSAPMESEEDPIDLEKCPPLRAEIICGGKDEHILRFSIHRILCDGFSTRLLLGEIAALYAGSLGETFLPLLDRAIQYADYARWEREWLAGETLAKQVEFFRRGFDGAEEAFTLPTDHGRPAQRLRRGSRLPFELAPEVAHAVQATAARERASIYMVLLAAFASALGKYTRRPTAVIGCAVSRRNQPGTEQILGQFMNTLPLRIDLANGSRLPTLVGHVKTAMLGALANQDAPFHHLKERLTEAHGAAAAGIGETVFVMADPAPGEMILGGISLTRMEPALVTSRRELTLSATAANGEIAGNMTYDRDLFNIETMQGILRDFETALLSARDSNV